jgi:hypothetical protein
MRGVILKNGGFDPATQGQPGDVTERSRDRDVAEMSPECELARAAMPRI